MMAINTNNWPIVFNEVGKKEISLSSRKTGNKLTD